MSKTRHDALIVTSHRREATRDAFWKAEETFGVNALTGIKRSPINSHWSFCVMTSGSKDGWPEKNTHDSAMRKMISWLKAQREVEDGDCYTPFEWVLVSYGSDDMTATVDDHEWKGRT